MPELAELRLTADYINHAARGLKYVNVRKNPVHKGKDIDVPFKKFYIMAKSRGKELMLLLSDAHSTKTLKLLMTMGMSGHFVQTNTGQEKKHSHLMFFDDDGTTLSFVDVRRFGKWKFVDDWSSNRGPDPTKEYEEFKKNIVDNMHKTAFKKPICEVLMNQGYFNGIGNYLRAEILYRIPSLNPFTPADKAIREHPIIFILSKELPLKAYALGGGQLKDWENPFKTEKERFERFMMCYGNTNMARVKDRNGRVLWFDPKWSKSLLYTLYNDA
jgi:endonuclease VIII-like 1